MNLMGQILPPLPHARQLFEGEEFINLCKALNTAVNSIAQTTQLQQKLINEYNSSEIVNNCGRIILFTTSKYRNLEQLQEFLNKSMQECNKNVDQLEKQAKNDKNNSLLKIKNIELVIIDVVPSDHNLTFDQEFFNQVIFKS
jgi:hypothetical protein